MYYFDDGDRIVDSVSLDFDFDGINFDPIFEGDCKVTGVIDLEANTQSVYGLQLWIQEHDNKDNDSSKPVTPDTKLDQKESEPIPDEKTDIVPEYTPEPTVEPEYVPEPTQDNQIQEDKIVPDPEPATGQNTDIFSAIGKLLSNAWDAFLKLFEW